MSKQSKQSWKEEEQQNDYAKEDILIYVAHNKHLRYNPKDCNDVTDLELEIYMKKRERESAFTCCVSLSF